MNKKNTYLSYVAFAQAFVAMVGSLICSELLHYPPCVLCWYQRICLYPLVIILGVGISSRDNKVYRYVLPLSLIGFGIALYHSLLYYGVIPEQYAPCTVGVSCTQKFFDVLGFVSIPLLSLITFTIISGCMLMIWKGLKNDPRK